MKVKMSNTKYKGEGKPKYLKALKKQTVKKVRAEGKSKWKWEISNWT